MATSDEFDGDLSLWTEVDPSSAGVFTVVAGQLQLVHAAGNDTDLWEDQKDAPRLIQAVTTPLDIATKLAAVPAEDGGYGLVVSDAARTNLVRLDYFTNGGVVRLFFAHVNAAASEIGFNAAVAGNPLYLRIVMPNGSSAEAYTSPDGETWTLRDTLDLTIDGAMTAAEAGPYGSGAFSPFPGETYLFDWVRFDLTPGGGGGGSETTADSAALTLAFGTPTVHVDHVTTAETFSLTAAFGTPASQGGGETAADPLALTLAFGQPVVAASFSVTAEPFALTLAFGTQELEPAVPLPALGTVLPDLAVVTEFDLSTSTELPDATVLTELPTLAVLTTVER